MLPRFPDDVKVGRYDLGRLDLIFVNDDVREGRLIRRTRVGFQCFRVCLQRLRYRLCHQCLDLPGARALRHVGDGILDDLRHIRRRGVG